MPVYKRITIDEHSKLLIWKVEEVENELADGIDLTPESRKRLDNMKSQMHRKAFLSIRQLFNHFGYEDKDVVYDEKGKPHLSDGNYISITHSFHFTAVIVSNKKVGVDIEKQRDKIKKIASKFTPIEEYEALGEDDLVKKLTIVWGSKESLYKLYGKKGLLFLHHIFVNDFNFEDSTTSATVTYAGLINKYLLHFFEIEDFICVYAMEP